MLHAVQSLCVFWIKIQILKCYCTLQKEKKKYKRNKFIILYT